MATFTREFQRVTCPGCNRRISAYVPHFGDGTGLRVVKHNLLASRHRASAACPYSERMIVRNQERGPDQGKWRLDP